MLKYWKLFIGAIVSAFFLVMALRGLDLAHVWADIQTAHYIWIFPGVAVYFVGVWVRAWRWHYLLRSIKPVPLATMWPIVVIGYMGNNIYPFRAGEFLRAYMLKKKEGISISASIATILVERIFDGLVMLLFVFIALPLAPGLPQWLRQVVVYASVAFLGALVLFLLMASLPTLSRRLYHSVVLTCAPQKIQAQLLALMDRFMEGISSLNSLPNIIMIFFTSIIIWLLETIKYWFVMYAFAFTVSFFALMLMNGVVNLATTLPSAPGYIGTFDGPGIEVLKVFGVDPVVAAAYTLVLHAALWLPITLLGAYYMARQSLSWRDFGKAVEESNAELAAESPANQHPPSPSSSTTTVKNST